MKCDVDFKDLVDAYYDCRANKRRTDSAITFELNLEVNLKRLHTELIDGTYQIGRSVCFVVEKPRIREIWSAEFRDRIVHHLIYNRLSPKWNKSFIADSCACIPGRGTKYGAVRLESHIRSFTENWKHDYFYLKCDLANFFVSIDKNILWSLIEPKIDTEWVKYLTKKVLYNNPREGAVFSSSQELMDKVPSHKRLLLTPPNLGLPIGNLTSQFFANILLDSLDKYVKHDLKTEKYIRYVDDCIILGRTTDELLEIFSKMKEKVSLLNLSFNPKKCFIQPISRGVSFVGQTIYPYRRVPLHNTVSNCFQKVVETPESLQSFAAYFGQAEKSYNLVNKLFRSIP